MGREAARLGKTKCLSQEVQVFRLARVVVRSKRLLGSLIFSEFSRLLGQTVSLIRHWRIRQGLRLFGPSYVEESSCELSNGLALLAASLWPFVFLANLLHLAVVVST